MTGFAKTNAEPKHFPLCTALRFKVKNSMNILDTINPIRLTWNQLILLGAKLYTDKIPTKIF